MQQRIPITEVREWNDTGLSELIQPYTDPAFNQHMLEDENMFGRGATYGFQNLV